MKDEQIKKEELKVFALEDEALEGVSGGVRRSLSGSEDELDSEYAPNIMPNNL